MAYTIELYRINVVSGTFELIEEIETYQGLDFYDRLNGIGGAAFSMDARDPKVTTSSFKRYRTNVAIKKNNTIVWVGPITKITRVVGDVNDIVSVQCESYFSHLKARFSQAQRLFTSTEAGTIAWTLIDESQSQNNGDLLISQGTVQATDTKSRTYYYKNIAKAIQQLTRVENPLNFNLTYQTDSDGKLSGILFNTFATLGRIRHDLNELKPGDNVQLVSYSTQKSIYNTITGLGAGTGEGILTSFAEDVTGQQGFTRRELVLPQKDISVPETLDELANKQLQELSGEKYHLEFELLPGSFPRLGDYIIGDSLQINLSGLNTNFFNIVTTGRVIEQSVSIDQNGVEFIRPKIEIFV